MHWAEAVVCETHLACWYTEHDGRDTVPPRSDAYCTDASTIRRVQERVAIIENPLVTFGNRFPRETGRRKTAINLWMTWNFCVSVGAPFYSNRARKDHSRNLAPAFCIIRGLRMPHARPPRGGCNPVTSLSLSLCLSLALFLSALLPAKRSNSTRSPPEFLLEGDPSGSYNEIESWSGEKTESTADAGLYSRLVLSKHGRRL